MTFLSFCSSIKEKFISFTSKLFKSKKVGNNKFDTNGNKFDNSENEESNAVRTERLLRSILLRLEVIENKLTKMIEEKHKVIEETFDKNGSNKRYKVL